MGYSDEEISLAHRTSTNILEGPQMARDVANSAYDRARRADERIDGVKPAAAI